jgi:hypothetical protein
MSGQAARADAIVAQLDRVLSKEDDPRLWRCLVATLLDDIDAIVASSATKDEILLEIGSCAHWLHPHQTRWTAAGGFAWPAGYGDGDGHGRHGLPSFDVSRVFHRDRATAAWHPTKGVGRRPFLLRVAVPTRTARHPQAAVHTIWTPGSPPRPDMKRERFLGFRVVDDGWRLVADSLPLWQ